MEFKHRSNYNHVFPPEYKGKSITDRAGYITLKQQIESVLNAGRRLEDHRRGNPVFDFMPGTNIDPNFDDPTRAPGFDSVDAHILSREVNANLEQQLKEAQNAKNNNINTGDTGLKASQTSQDGRRDVENKVVDNDVKKV